MRLGSPPKNPEINAAHKQQLSADQRKRNEVEECFGSVKRKYSLDLIMGRLPKSAATMISLVFLVMCAERIRRLLRLFFGIIFAWLSASRATGSIRMAFRCVLELDQGELAVLYNRSGELPAPLLLVQNREGSPPDLSGFLKCTSANQLNYDLA